MMESRSRLQFRLYGTQICAKYIGLWVLLGWKMSECNVL
jgi:hypothetical protein